MVYFIPCFGGTCSCTPVTYSQNKNACEPLSYSCSLEKHYSTDHAMFKGSVEPLFKHMHRKHFAINTFSHPQDTSLHVLRHCFFKCKNKWTKVRLIFFDTVTTLLKSLKSLILTSWSLYLRLHRWNNLSLPKITLQGLRGAVRWSPGRLLAQFQVLKIHNPSGFTNAKVLKNKFKKLLLQQTKLNFCSHKKLSR